MINDKRIKETIELGINFIKRNQKSNGSFDSLTSKDKVFSESTTEKTTFFSSLIGLAIKDIVPAQPVLNKAAGYLLSQKNDNWTFNYWDKGWGKNKPDKYPDDLDDTSCALSMIYLSKPKETGGKAIARLVSVLTSLEVKEGGPYRTWLVPETASTTWKDVDVAVNSNVGYFLSLLDIYLPNIERFIDRAIADQQISSPYYAGDLPVIYFISRFYKGAQKRKLVERIRSEGIGKLNYLELALAGSSLISLGFADDFLQKIIEKLVKEFKAESNKPFPFIIEKARNGVTYYSGSAVLTCAITIEALNNYLRKKSLTKDERSKDKSSEMVFKAVIQETKKRFDKIRDEDGSKIFRKLVDKIASKEIILLPQLFASALEPNLQKKISEKYLIELGKANLYGWIAYSIYDDFLDEEGDPQKLSIANICLRELNEIFQSVLPQNPLFYVFAKETMDCIDSANLWEIKYCRPSAKGIISKDSLPNYHNLKKIADKSIGHALGPSAILHLLGFEKNSDEHKNIMRLMKHYLIARQLNDDAHDWECDLRNGHISYPVSQLISDLDRRSVDIAEIDLALLQKVFWGTSIIKICKRTLYHVRQAERCLNQSKIVSGKARISSLLLPLKKSTLEALLEREKMVEFLEDINL